MKHSLGRLQIDLSEVRKVISSRITSPPVRLLARTPVTPNMLTWAGFGLAIVAAVLISTGQLLIAGMVVLLAGLFDILDGALARQTNRITRFGGILDSTLDRLSEGAELVGALVFYAQQQVVFGAWLVGVTMVSSFAVSYIRSRAETAGIKCEVGISTRTERVILLALGLLFNQLIIALAFIALTSLITVAQRLVHSWRQTR
ncbi:MAG: CDP-alcohol phosphatidyltransferase family protein [Chloroflexi bacterium]|nr:CDP-alcohol phosphatidyltransferase family protein [Chloroflexota bacterium]